MLNYLSNGSVKQKNVSIYVDELAELYEKITINAGIRLDYFNFNYNDLMTQNIGTENKFTISPKLSLYYNAASDVQLFAKTGLGFHSNDARVVVAQTHENTLPKAFGYEAGSVFKLGKNIIANVSLWGLNLESEFVYVGDEAIVEPSGKTRRLGVDFSVRSQLTRWLWADADFNYTYGRFIDEPEGNNRIPLAPVFTSIGGLSFKLNNGLSGSLRYRYMATRPANENNSVNAGGYFITDAVLNYSFSNYTVGVSVENLLNNRSWNEAQFDTESRLAGEVLPVSELHFTPGKPIFVKAMLGVNF
jgi:outer membrane receptor for Fe3+-dicitrate